jgi:predicted regulator of Ras-like GTPase activity (Roadblock/LC7/MglB family)
MSEDIYADALKTTLTEVRNICPEVTRSFIFTKDGTIIAEAAQDAEVSTEKMFYSFQSLMEKAGTIGGLNTFLVNGSKGAVQISRLNNMYLALSASKKADIVYIQSVANIIVPTVLKLLEIIVSTPLKSSSSPQDLMAENLTGLFAGETAQVDNEVLKEWSENFNNVHIDEIEIETANGKIARCRVKAISEREFKGKGLIRIPEKIYRTLEVEKGEQVKVKPITPEGK